VVRQTKRVAACIPIVPLNAEYEEMAEDKLLIINTFEF